MAVVRCLDANEHGEERISDFRAAALAALAEAKRQRNDLETAWDAFATAEESLDEGTGDPLDRAELELLRERLLRDSGNEEAAERARHRARSLFRQVGDPRSDAVDSHLESPRTRTVRK